MSRYVPDTYEIVCENEKYKVKNTKTGNFILTADTEEKARNFITYIVHYPLLKKSSDD